MQRVKALGQTAVAITDHGVMYGCVDFYKAAKKAGVKPIIGCEVYVATRTRFDKVNRIDGSNHLVLLCKNETGYKNLIKMVSVGFTEGFYNKPRVDHELLEEYHEGLICLSRLPCGETPQLIGGDYEKARILRGTMKICSAKETIILRYRTIGWTSSARCCPCLCGFPGNRHSSGRHQRRPLS